MTINDFRSRICRHLDVFIAKYKQLHDQNPVQYPLELDSFIEWEENFMIFSEDLELNK